MSGVRKKLKSFYKKRNLKKHLWALRILMANNQILKPIMYFICTKPVPSSPCMGLKDNIPSITFSGGDTSVIDIILGSLSSDVFERRTSTGSEPFSLLISLYATLLILPSVLILIETICPKICSKSRLKCAKRPFPVDMRRSKTSLLKLPIVKV